MPYWETDVENTKINGKRDERATTYAYSGFITREEARQRVEGKTEFFMNTYTYNNRGQLVSVFTLKEVKSKLFIYGMDVQLILL